MRSAAHYAHAHTRTRTHDAMRCDAHRWTQEQLFAMVADVDSYEEFLPWCSSSRVITKRDGGCTAEIAVGFPPVHERYVSEVCVFVCVCVCVCVNARARRARFFVFWSERTGVAVLSYGHIAHVADVFVVFVVLCGCCCHRSRLCCRWRSTPRATRSALLRRRATYSKSLLTRGRLHRGHRTPLLDRLSPALTFMSRCVCALLYSMFSSALRSVFHVHVTARANLVLCYVLLCFTHSLLRPCHGV
jgi:hypothetical protein